MINSIRQLLRKDGRLLTTPADIKEEAINYFTEHLNHQPSTYKGCSPDFISDLLGFRCSPADQGSLIKLVTDEEIRETLLKFPHDKSPGPDGYTAEFFIAAWPIIGCDLVAAIKSFFIKCFLPKGQNSTILALLPKKENATSITDYRPISCCNLLYKIIAKILANRLKVLLPRIISSNQSAFVEGRLLMENVLLASELVKDYHKKDVSPRCTLQIDLAKAFDSVQWEFVLATLNALGFPAIYVRWIELCISSASFSVQVNGEMVGYFGSSRGLRQGCPMSPYLFVLCMNVLSHMLDKGASTRKFDFHPKCKLMNLTHLCFADDILVFSDGKQRSIEGVLDVFAKFEGISGLQVNLSKSTIFSTGVDSQTLTAITTAYNISTGSLPVRYLGLPLLTKRMQSRDYAPLVERIRTKLISWKGRLLSYAGRLQLLRAVISSITNFWTSAFLLPKRCIREINSLCSAFLWSGPDLTKGKAKIAWWDVCKPKSEGGLGIRKIDDGNRVSSLKLIWRLLSTTSLWSAWVNLNLLRNNNFWSPTVPQSLGSWIWRKVLRLRQLASDFHIMAVGNGERTSFWFDNWSTLGRLMPSAANVRIALGIPFHSTLAQASLSSRRRCIRYLGFRRLLEEAEKTFRNLTPLKRDRDKWKYGEDKFSTQFNSNSTWDLIRARTPSIPNLTAVWFSHSTPKYSFLVWLAFLNRLSTGDRFSNWTSRDQIKCLFCGCIVESRDHLFFICRFSSRIWGATIGTLMPNLTSISWSTITSSLAQGSTCPTTTFLARYSFQACVYYIWRERNKRKHTTSLKTEQTIIRFIDKDIRNKISSMRGQQNEIASSGLQLWFLSRSHVA